VLDGASGCVTVNPSEATLQRVRQDSREVRAPSPIGPVSGIEVMANISVWKDAEDAVAMKAEGVGLYRTEYEFIAAGRLLDEDDQVERYRRVQEMMAGRPVTYRLFDAGGDKPLPFLDFPEEENPALGWRGARLLLGMPELMRTQARALARVSATGPVRVMYPMVTDVDQFRLLLGRFEEATADIECGRIEHGVMFEVPSACLQAEAIYEVAAFGSIGSNDLIQYLFAVDRNNELVAADYSADAPVFWELLKRLVEAAKQAGKPLSICGEMAGDPVYVRRLLDVGVRSISVSSRMIPVSREIAVEMKEADRAES
jgi:phosphoenolpyruvate-protein kinase (PTS system EI component)